MTEVLLKELNNPDIDWMLAVGEIVELSAGTVLIQPGRSIADLYILLEGVLSVALGSPAQEIAQLVSGELVGAIPFLEPYLMSTTVKAQTQVWVLAIPRSLLALKLHDDASFAAHLYRTIAVLSANRLTHLIQQVGHSAILSQPQRESVTVFAELQDSDLDWLIAAGQVQPIAAETILVRSGRPIDALHILLEGVLVLSTAENDTNRVAKAFSNQSQPEREFARLSRGDLVGEMLFVEASLSAIAVKTLRDCQILSIPRWRLAAKLLHDVGFATRFYRVLAILLANKQQAIYQRLVYGSGQTPDIATHTDLDNQFLTRVALAEARFEWMLKRIQVKTGSVMQW